MCVILMNVYAYELPTIEFKESDKAEIILFSAESVLVGKKLSYVIRWKTLNADKVIAKDFGEIALNGEGTITEDEYKAGPITIIATNSKNGSRDSKTVNKHLEADRVAPVMNVKVTERDYYEGGIPRTYNRIWNRRQIH